MIKSELISKIIELSIEGEKYENELFAQIKLLTETKRKHTRVGLYVYLKPENGIEQHRLSKSQLKQMLGENSHHLTKYEMINEYENVLADLTIHFSNGLIDCVEIWNKLGDYPKKELLTYELKRI